MFSKNQKVKGKIVVLNQGEFPFNEAVVTKVSEDGSKVEEIQLLEDLPGTDLTKGSKIKTYQPDQPNYITNVIAINAELD